MVTAATKEVEVSMAEDAENDAEEVVDKAYEDVVEEIMEKVAPHMKMRLISQMTPVTLKMKSEPHF